MATGGSASQGYDGRVAARPGSLLRRSSGVCYYYNSLDDSLSACSSVSTVQGLDTPLPDDHLEDSSDIEREDDRDSVYFIGNNGSSAGAQKLGSNIQAQDVVGDREGHDEEGKNCDGLRQCDENGGSLNETTSPYTLTCVLIPFWTVKHWKQCKQCYLAVIITLLLLILAVLSLATVWSIQLIKYRPHILKREDLSSSAVFNVTSSFPDQTNIFSTQLCLNISESHSTRYYVNKVAYVTLASEDCRSVALSPYNRTVSQNSLFGHNYMFFWLKGTTVSFSAVMNGSTVMSILLLNSKESFNYCLDHLIPSDYLKLWAFNFSNCGLVPATGLLSCHFDYKVTSSGYYYICVNSTVLYGLQYNFSISSFLYNTSKSSLAVECVASDECCVPFGSVFYELSRPTCMFVTTRPLSPEFTGVRLTDISVRVDQRWDVVWYCLISLIPLVLLLMLTILLCRMTKKKVEHPSTNGGCVIYCNVYGQK